MPRRPRNRKVWECQSVLDASKAPEHRCGYRYEDPIGATAVQCPKVHRNKAGARFTAFLTCIAEGKAAADA